ncbi:sensor histidine kinase [Gulbenkiania mobilis]|uniref:sensor histidine kinase n=1 Tax=Gulbenkiania mobilis TaxID=397457 RepID=UPI0006BBDA96|nr:ATP-binding protein [Gulbenkiania mobilis]
MNSLYRSLTVLLLVLCNLVLVPMAWLTYERTQNESQALYTANRAALKARLTRTLPPVVWQLDERLIVENLDAELSTPGVLAIELVGDAGLRLGRVCDGEAIRDLAPSERPGADEVLTLPIIYQGGEPLAQAWVYLSHQGLAEADQARLGWLAVAVILTNLLLLGALAWLWQRVTERPLIRLRQVLDALAQPGAPLPDWQPRREELLPLAESCRRISERLTASDNRCQAAEAALDTARRQAEDSRRSWRTARQLVVRSEKPAAIGRLAAGVASAIHSAAGSSLDLSTQLHAATHELYETLPDTGDSGPLARYCRDAEGCSLALLEHTRQISALVGSLRQIALDQEHNPRRDFQLKDYLNDLLTCLRAGYSPLPAELKLDCPADLVLNSYPGTFAQVIIQLVSNALEHAFTHHARYGEVVIRGTRQDGDAVRLVIQDNGAGLPEHARQWFETSCPTPEEDTQGAVGPGLLIVCMLVRQELGGDIHMESQPGHGTTYTLTLPTLAPQRRRGTEDA